jgi:RNA-binding protein YlmH
VATTSALSDSEKQWLQNFERKLDELHSGETYNTAFLDPRQLELAEATLKKMPAYSYTVYGGHPAAERNVLRIFPAQHQPTLPSLEAIKVSWADSDEIGHRDLLGAVMALGLRRDQVGDIIVLGDTEAAVIVGETRGDYIMAGLTQAGRTPVSCEVVEPESLELAKDDGRQIKGTVASLRVDAILSLGFGISRSRVVLLVKGGLVRVNWRPISSPSHQLSEGDQVSLKGRGRILVESVEGETRKGRMRVKLKKYG